MKNLKIFITLLAAISLTACVQDLNTHPIDPHSSTSFNQSRMFTKCYATLATSGQQGPAGQSDIDGADEGCSSFYRSIWYCNVLSSDEGWWIWDDVKDGVSQLRVNAWDGENGSVVGSYSRLGMDVKYFNHFLTYADSTTTEGQVQRAEVRFLRALNYAYMLDLFRYIPFGDRESDQFPHYYTRPQLYKWLVNELVELTEELPTKRVNKWRVDQAAAWLMLGRLYLNADVYNKENEEWVKGSCWKLAEEAADKALGYGYDLYQDPTDYPNGTHYSAYQKLFMGDNDRNGSCDKEAVLLIYQDGIYCRCYGGAQFLTAGTRKTTMRSWGNTLNWGCFRTSPTAVYKFTKLAGYSESQAASILADEFAMPGKLKDDRAILCSANGEQLWTLAGNRSAGAEKNFYDCWGFCKFTNVYSTAATPEESVGTDKEWPDLDIPFLRIAEAYLTKAEAQFRQGREQEAINLINTTIRARANADPLAVTGTANVEMAILDEWSREFMGEGRRRMDLIRFGRYFGPESDQNHYNWEGRANTNHGDQFFKSGTEEYLNWFPVPSQDKRVNPNFTNEIMATSELYGGDGYGY